MLNIPYLTSPGPFGIRAVRAARRIKPALTPLRDPWRMPEPQAPAFSPGLAHRLWRCLPPAVRRRALARATALIAPRPAERPPWGAHGIAVAGAFSCPSGLGESARLMVRAARAMQLPAWSLDVPSPLAIGLGAARGAEAEGGDPPEGAPLVLHVNAPTLPLALLRLPRGLMRERRVVGCWAWELPVVPAEWHAAARFVHEVWAPSRFTALALEPLAPHRVHVVPPALALAPPIPAVLDRAAFGLPADAVVVLVSFNLASSFARKNPLAAVHAFKQAFGQRADRILVLKVGLADHAPADFARLMQDAAAPNIRVMTDMLPDRDRHALTACCDIVLSLHRSEGFGLVPAEAMLLGKPVIATAWSGNMDYMDEANAALVRYRLVPVQDDRAVYRDGYWAEPDVADAVSYLRYLADHASARRGMGNRARATAMHRLDGTALRKALRGLGLAIDGQAPRAAPPAGPRTRAADAPVVVCADAERVREDADESVG